MNVLQKPRWPLREATIVIPRRRRNIVEEQLDNEAVLINPCNGHVYRLNETAVCVWRSCDGQATMRRIVEQMIAGYDVDSEDALDYVYQLVALFAESDLLELDSGA